MKMYWKSYNWSNKSLIILRVLENYFKTKPTSFNRLNFICRPYPMLQTKPEMFPFLQLNICTIPHCESKTHSKPALTACHMHLYSTKQVTDRKQLLTCIGVKATLEAVPEICFLREVVAPPHVACCFCIFRFSVCDTRTLVFSSI